MENWLIMKLLEMVKDFLGTSYSERLKNKYSLEYKRKETEATVQQIKILSDAISETAQQHTNLDIEFNRDGLMIKPKNQLSNVADRAITRLNHQEIRKQQNIESVIQQACDIASSDSDLSLIESGQVSEDWISRFFNSVEDISDSNMQHIWASILAGEIKRPTSYSFRTLEILRNLSVDEAYLFERYAQFALFANDVFIIKNDEIWNKYNLSYGDALLLDDCGLLSVRDTSYTFHPPLNPAIPNPLFNNKKLIGIISNNSKEVKVSCFTFTKSAKELFNLLKVNFNDDYTLDCIRYVQKRYAQYNVSAHELVKLADQNGDMLYKAEPIDIDHRC